MSFHCNEISSAETAATALDRLDQEVHLIAAFPKVTTSAKYDCRRNIAMTVRVNQVQKVASARICRLV